MAGRPKTTAARMTAMEEDAASLLATVFTTAPEGLVSDFLHGRSMPNTQAAGLWENLFRTVWGTAMLAEMVGRFYRKRASLDEAGPMAELFDDSPSGPVKATASPNEAADPT